jgi:ATP-dependent Clp protease, protease subunit
MKKRVINKLQQLFLDNSGRSNGFRIENRSDSTEIFVYDAIGDFFGVQATEFVKEIGAIESENIKLRINSPGGDVFEAKAIASAIRSHPAQITAQIDGLAASAATTVALAADQVHMTEGSFFMIHNAWTMMMGNADELRDMAGVLDKVDDSIVADYHRKTGASEETIVAWMNDETWFNDAEALEHGFVDLVLHHEAPAKNQWDLSAYENTPTKLKLIEDEFDHESAKAKALRRLQLIERTAA